MARANVTRARDVKKQNHWLDLLNEHARLNERVEV